MSSVRGLVLHSDLSQALTNTPLAPLKTKKDPLPHPCSSREKRKGGTGGVLPAECNVSHHIVRSIFRSLHW